MYGVFSFMHELITPVKVCVLAADPYPNDAWDDTLNTNSLWHLVVFLIDFAFQVTEDKNHALNLITPFSALVLCD